jgi:hypothetical protein
MTAATIKHATLTNAAADTTALVDGPKWDAAHTLSGPWTPDQGGTGVANNAASTVTISGAYAITITLTATTSLTFPTSGTLATTSDLAAGYQPLDATLTAVAGVVTAANKLIYFNGVDTATSADLTAAGRALIDDADAAAQRTTLGLGTAATQNTSTSGANVPLLNGANTWSATQTFATIAGSLVSISTNVNGVNRNTFQNTSGGATAYNLITLGNDVIATGAEFGITGSGNSSTYGSGSDTIFLAGGIGNFTVRMNGGTGEFSVYQNSGTIKTLGINGSTYTATFAGQVVSTKATGGLGYGTGRAALSRRPPARQLASLSVPFAVLSP